jgi:hypothetical protein
MRIVSDDKTIRRNSQIGKYTLTAGMVLLVGALVINIMALTRPQDANLLTYVIAAFFVGFTLTNIGTVFNNRWGRRPDRVLADGLKGLDERWTFYNYRLGASHVLIGPGGPIVLVPKFQAGPVEFNGKRWTNPGGRRSFFGLMNPDPLGNPVAEANAEAETLKRFVQKHEPNLDIEPQPIVVFVHPRAEVSAKDSPIPALHIKQLKEHIRRLPKNPDFSPRAIAALVEHKQDGAAKKPA